MGKTQLITDKEYAAAAIAAVSEAKREILICAYAWRWYENQLERPLQEFNMALARVRGRGVAVRVLVDHVTNPAPLMAAGFAVKVVEGAATLHAKAISVDDDYLLLGSHNLNHRANSANYETSLLTTELEPLLQYKTYFEKIWAAV